MSYFFCGFNFFHLTKICSLAKIVICLLNCFDDLTYSVFNDCMCSILLSLFLIFPIKWFSIFDLELIFYKMFCILSDDFLNPKSIDQVFYVLKDQVSFVFLTSWISFETFFFTIIEQLFLTFLYFKVIFH